MKFEKLALSGAYLIHTDPSEDQRGCFTRIFCEEKFKEYELECVFSQVSLSFNKNKNTLRGLHYQAAPYEEIKLIRCIKGSVYDVIVDLREESDTYGKWLGVELSAKNHCMLYVPKNFAHGFKTLEDNSELLYFISTPYVAQAARGVHWRDPKLQINWPGEEPILSDRDNHLPIIKMVA